MHIRPALPADSEAIAAIYAHHVLHGTGTFEEVPPTLADMTARIADVQDKGWPWRVADADGGIAGYASARQLNPRSGYRLTCENSVYVAADATGCGVGTALLAAVIAAATTCGFRQMVAVIGDSANTASIALHARAGFRHVGQLDAVGLKFGRLLDVVHMQRAIG